MNKKLSWKNKTKKPEKGALNLNRLFQLFIYYFESLNFIVFYYLSQLFLPVLRHLHAELGRLRRRSRVGLLATGGGGGGRNICGGGGGGGLDHRIWIAEVPV